MSKKVLVSAASMRAGSGSELREHLPRSKLFRHSVKGISCEVPRVPESVRDCTNGLTLVNVLQAIPAFFLIQLLRSVARRAVAAEAPQ